jgi:lysophospholipase L1-like esterase
MKFINRYIYIISCIEAVIIVSLVQNLYRGINKKSVNSINSHFITYPVPEIPHYYELIPNVTDIDRADWLPNYQVTYTYNADGQNDRFNYLINKKEKTYRIAAIGDSFTFGSYVATKDNWTEILEDTLNNKPLCGPQDKYEVINFGVRGYDAQDETMSFFRKAAKYSPDMIIWFLYVNDFNENNELIYSHIMNNSIINHSNEWETNAQEIYNDHKDYIEQLVSKDIQRVLDSYKGIIVFMVLPGTPNQYKSQVRNLMKNRNAFLFDTMKDIYSNFGSYMPYNGHPNQLGHQIIANGIYSYLHDTQRIADSVCNSN